MNESAPIIVVEHDRALRVMYRTILTNLKIKNQLLFFDSGTELLDFCKKDYETPLFILSNARLPRMKGSDLKKKIDALNCKLSCVPFVLLCESCTEDEVNAAKALGVDHVISGNDHYETLKQQMEELVRNLHNTVTYERYAGRSR